MYFSYNITRQWLKIEWRDWSCMKLEVKVAKNTDEKNSVTFRSSRQLLIYEKRDCMSEFLQPKFLFCCFFVILAQLMRSPFNRLNLLGEDLSNQTLNLQMEFASLNIAITAIYQSQLLYLHRVLEFRTYFFIENCLPQASRIKFDASMPSESEQVHHLNQPLLRS